MLNPAPPLVVDLDGTLLRGDLLHESAWWLLREQPLLLFALPGWLGAGRAALKRRIAERVNLDVARLPYDEALLAFVREQRALGRRTVLATASDALLAQAVAAHLGCFDEVIASDGVHNLKGPHKAAALVKRFGERGFDYAGDTAADLRVWAVSREAIVVGRPALARRAREVAPVVHERPRSSAAQTLGDWRQALRLHQWSKNLLIGLPLLGAHRLAEPALLLLALQAFIAMGLAASANYLLNDLVDLDHDRSHPRKRLRPFAAGAIALPQGFAAAGLLFVAAFALAFALSPPFALCVAIYVAITLAYSFALKRRLLLDAITLAALYTLRVVAGGVALGIAASFWLLTFSMFLFLSLAFVKRCSELLMLADEGQPGSAGRGYTTEDLSLVQMFGVASGFSAVLVLALYIDSAAVQRLYRTPQMLWLELPLLLYWVGRMWTKAQRRLMHDDPVVFALRDGVSLCCAALFGAVLWLATKAW